MWTVEGWPCYESGCVLCRRDDEHQLIAQYCQSLNGGDAVPVPRSPVQIMVAIDQEQREELEAMIRYV